MNARRAWAWLQGLFKQFPGAKQQILEQASPTLVKARLPRSAFTKKGPGVRASLRYTLKKMTVEQRKIAYENGWSKGLCTADGRMLP